MSDQEFQNERQQAYNYLEDAQCSLRKVLGFLAMTPKAIERKSSPSLLFAVSSPSTLATLVEILEKLEGVRGDIATVTNDDPHQLCITSTCEEVEG